MEVVSTIYSYRFSIDKADRGNIFSALSDQETTHTNISAISTSQEKIEIS